MKYILALLLAVGWSGIALAGPDGVIRESVAACDPNSPTHCVAPDASGNLPINPTGAKVTPVAGTASAVVTGGTAVTVVTGPVNGGYISNPLNAAAQGIGAAENAYIDPVAAPGSTDAAANGTTVIVSPGQNYTVPPLATGSVIKANAATNGHKLSVVVW